MTEVPEGPEGRVVRPTRVKVTGDWFHGVVPAGAVYVGRPAPGLPGSRYANPHRVGRPCRACRPDTVTHDQFGAVIAYARYLAERPDLVAAARVDLVVDLACWCTPSDPDRPCHGDVLVAVIAGADPAGLAAELSARERKLRP